MSNALEVQNLRKTYGDFKLDSVSFTLPAGYIMGFVGQNGAGKTTTIRCILNMAIREGGEIKIFGLDNLRDELAIKQELAAVCDTPVTQGHCCHTWPCLSFWIRDGHSCQQWFS
jgi:ABC-2 type transport system ATP-binding protein